MKRHQKEALFSTVETKELKEKRERNNLMKLDSLHGKMCLRSDATQALNVNLLLVS
jgi:hypothetical protein